MEVGDHLRQSTEITPGLAAGDKVVLHAEPARRRGNGRQHRRRRTRVPRGRPGGAVPPGAVRAARWRSSRGGAVSLIELADVRKTYDTGHLEVDALRGVDARIEEGEYVAVVGPSGSGKSTLMHILGCLDVPDRGHLPARRRGRLAAQRGPAGRGAQPADRLRLPAVQPAAPT